MQRLARFSLPIVVAVLGCSHFKRPTPYTPKPYFLDAEHAAGSSESGVITEESAPSSEASGTPGAAGSAAPATGATPLPPGKPLPELVGKWCYLANVQANDGGRQSNTCFQLNADGSYQYHSETSSSGQFGATASESDDEGRWQASGDTLTAQSTSGKITNYRFEKRNHPKTNDPMLVFDGQAFVTYFQKPPW